MPDTLVIAHGKAFEQTPVFPQLQTGQLSCAVITGVDQLAHMNPAVVILDSELLSTADIAQWKAATDAVLVAEETVSPDADLIAPPGYPFNSTIKMLRFACQRWVLERQQLNLAQVLVDKRGNLEKMADIGVALSAEKDLTRLLSKILTEGQGLSSCDAASLFLLDRSDESAPYLTFKLTQNSSIPSPFKEQQLPLTKSSIVGYVALVNEELNIADAYDLPEDAPYTFNHSFDLSMGYRCVSVLSIPMRNYRHEVVGVLQFINRKYDASEVLNDPETIPGKVQPFDEETASLLRALAGQAAVAIENRRLLDSINELFEGFVQASVFAIEQRDPTTSGHSFRVADFCVHLAQSLSQANLPRFKDLWFSQDEIREIRFAALLHDFGKVGVREHVLTKAKKLPDSSLELLHYRVALAKEHIHTRLLNRLVNSFDQHGTIDPEMRQRLTAEMQQEHLQLDQYLTRIVESNEPSILPEGSFEHLQEIRGYLAKDHSNKQTALISEAEFCALSIRKGSLNDSERLEIESHVVHTMNFLKLIPWTSELQSIPDIAGAHHEKLDGSGYPDGLSAEQIPLPSKIMTVCDIYDALTASDRPYKSAMPKEKALSILEFEAKDGMLDADIVKVFIEAKTHEVAHQKQYMSETAGTGVHHHHVCDHAVEELKTKL